MKKVVQDLTSGGLLGVWGKWVKHAKYIYNIQDFNPEQVLAVGYTKSKFITDAMMWFDKFSCKRSDLVITVGRDLVETVENRFKGKKVPKTVIKIFHREDGELESMVQRVYRQIKAVDTDATVTIATSKSQVSAIHNQLGEEVGISVEPCRRDTFPAIALAAAYLKDVQGVGEEESVVVCPVDPYVENDYFEALKALGDRAAVSSANLVLMGIEPTYPSEKYGYIIPIGKEQVSKVSMFKEKPTQEVAKDYIAKGALWNGGVFAFKLGYVLNRAHELIDFVDYEDLFNKYDTLNKISFDYAVVEHEPEIEVMRFAGTWKDLGTWNTLTEAMDSHAVGEAMFNEKCENSIVTSPLARAVCVASSAQAPTG